MPHFHRASGRETYKLPRARSIVPLPEVPPIRCLVVAVFVAIGARTVAYPACAEDADIADENFDALARIRGSQKIMMERTPPTRCGAAARICMSIYIY